MSKKEEFIGQKIIVPGRLSYAHLHEKHQFPEEKEAHYRTQILIPKTDSKTLKLIKDTIKKVFAQGVTKRLDGEKPGKWENPMHDGDVIADKKGEALSKTITRFRNQYFYPAKQGHGIVYEWALREGAESQIHERLKTCCLSLSSNDYLKLPKLRCNVVKVSLNTRKYKQTTKRSKKRGFWSSKKTS